MLHKSFKYSLAEMKICKSPLKNAINILDCEVTERQQTIMLFSSYIRC